MLYYHKTGYACGGIITPSFFALHIEDPWKLIFSMGAGVLTYLVLEGVVRIFGLYGRQRMAGAMLIALLLGWSLSGYWKETSIWLGWVMPGLIAADIQRQGLVFTLSGLTATGIATSMIARLWTCFLM